MEIQGTIIAVCPLQEGIGKQTGKPWQSQDYVLEYRVAERFIHKFVFNLFGDEIEKNDLHIGEVVKVHYDTDASEYGGRYFGKNSAWKVEKIGVENVAPQQHKEPTPQPQSQSQPTSQRQMDTSAPIHNTVPSPQPQTSQPTGVNTQAQSDFFGDEKQEDDLPF